MESLSRLRALARRRPRTTVLVAVGALAGVMALGTRAKPAEAAPPAGPGLAPVDLDLAPLCAAEAALARPLLPADERQFGDTLAYWWSVNDALFGELDASVRRLYVAPPGRGLVCIAAAPGDAAVVGRALRAAAGERLCRIDLGALLARDRFVRAELDVVDEPVLASADGRHVLARLPGLRDPDRLDLQALVLLAASSGSPYGRLAGSVLLIDGLDRVAPATALATLRLLEGLASGALGARDAALLCVAVGAPEAFAPWMEGRAAAVPALERPRFTTTGDLAHLARAHLALEVGRWPTEGELATFRDLVGRHPFLQATVADPGLCGLIAEHAGQLAGRPALELRDWLHRRILERAAASHLRPADPAGPYGMALEEVAARYAAGADGSGAFAVGSGDTVALELDGEVCELRVGDLLERSGLAWREPGSSGAARYRFDPLWLHGHMARRWLDRRAPGLSPPGCGP